LKRDQQVTGRSIGVVDVREIVGVSLVSKSPDALAEFQEQMKAVRRQPDMFRPEYLKLDFLPYDLKLSWRCQDECAECANSPHQMKALDWGLLELARRDGWDKAKARLETICNLAEYNFRIFMGNFRNHPWTFGVIGLWYPKKRPQYDLLDANSP
jgi:hypothetical protein